MLPEINELRNCPYDLVRLEMAKAADLAMQKQEAEWINGVWNKEKAFDDLNNRLALLEVYPDVVVNV